MDLGLFAFGFWIRCFWICEFFGGMAGASDASWKWRGCRGPCVETEKESSSSSKSLKRRVEGKAWSNCGMPVAATNGPAGKKAHVEQGFKKAALPFVGDLFEWNWSSCQLVVSSLKQEVIQLQFVEVLYGDLLTRNHGQSGIDKVVKVPFFTSSFIFHQSGSPITAHQALQTMKVARNRFFPPKGRSFKDFGTATQKEMQVISEWKEFYQSIQHKEVDRVTNECELKCNTPGPLGCRGRRVFECCPRSGDHYCSSINHMNKKWTKIFRASGLGVCVMCNRLFTSMGNEGRQDSIDDAILCWIEFDKIQQAARNEVRAINEKFPKSDAKVLADERDTMPVSRLPCEHPRSRPPPAPGRRCQLSSMHMIWNEFHMFSVFEISRAIREDSDGVFEKFVEILFMPVPFSFGDKSWRLVKEKYGSRYSVTKLEFKSETFDSRLFLNKFELFSEVYSQTKLVCLDLLLRGLCSVDECFQLMDLILEMTKSNGLVKLRAGMHIFSFGQISKGVALMGLAQLLEKREAKNREAGKRKHILNWEDFLQALMPPARDAVGMGVQRVFGDGDCWDRNNQTLTVAFATRSINWTMTHDMLKREITGFVREKMAKMFLPRVLEVDIFQSQ